jgi:hypothetical protein
MTTREILELSLEMAEFDAVPADSAIYVAGKAIRRVLIGIDMEVPELLFARDEGFDLVISHHPEGGAAALNFPEVLRRHVDFMLELGVPEAVADGAVRDLIHDARCRAHASNYDRAPAMARRLGMPYMNIHLPLDEIGRRRMLEVVGGLAPEQSVGELLEALGRELPECRLAATDLELRVGLAPNPIGRAAVIHAAGTNGGYSVGRALFEHGIKTLIYIHCGGADSRRLQKEFHDRDCNLVITGHMTGDSIGINPFVDALISRGLEVVCMSGIIRPGISF